MTKQQIVEFYKLWREKILSEMKEYFDQPLQNIKKINNNEYLAIEDDLEIDFTFTRRFGGDIINLPNSIDKKQVQDYWELSWVFKKGEKNNKNFLRACGTSFSIIKDFLASNNNIKIIYFSGLTRGHDSIYSGSYKNKIENLFGREYSYIIKDDGGIKSYFLVNKTILESNYGSIEKRAKSTSLIESIIYWRYPDFHPSTPPNIKIKNRIKQKVVENLYIKEIKQI